MVNMVIDEVIKKLNEEIKARGFTKKEVAKRLEVSPSALSSALTRQNIKLSMVIRITEMIGTTLRDIYPKGIYDQWIDLPLIDLIRVVCQDEVKSIVLDSKIQNSITLDSKIKHKKK